MKFWCCFDFENWYCGIFPRNCGALCCNTTQNISTSQHWEKARRSHRKKNEPNIVWTHYFHGWRYSYIFLLAPTEKCESLLFRSVCQSKWIHRLFFSRREYNLFSNSQNLSGLASLSIHCPPYVRSLLVTRRPNRRSNQIRSDWFIDLWEISNL